MVAEHDGMKRYGPDHHLVFVQQGQGFGAVSYQGLDLEPPVAVLCAGHGAGREASGLREHQSGLFVSEGAVHGVVGVCELHQVHGFGEKGVVHAQDFHHPVEGKPQLADFEVSVLARESFVVQDHQV